MEGDREAVRAARRRIQNASGKAIEVADGASAAYGAALAFSSAFCTPLMEAAAVCLHETGIPAGEAARLAVLLFEQALRAHRRGGRKSWSGPLAVSDEAEVLRQLAALESIDPRLARYYRESCVFALDFLGRHPELARTIRNWSER
jgi:predicted short-subunit dehydrogenase-like oxidoreductase (DUF2520 family)